jgi:chromosome segregation ATPase
VSSMLAPASAVEPTKPASSERPSMSDEGTREIAVSTVRERVAEEDIAEHVLAAIEDRADDGRLSIDAMADWHRTCREHRRSTADDLEAAADRLDELRASLDPIDRDTTHVQARFDEYEGEFDDLRSTLSTAADRLAAATARPDSPAAVYEAAERLRQCEGAIHDVAHALHHLDEEFDMFETWLDDPETRIDELGDEIEGFERYLDNTEGLLGRLESGSTGSTDPFDAWLAAYHLQRMMTLVFDELHDDIAELETWLAEQEGGYEDEAAALRGRLETLEERHEGCSKRLDAATMEVEGFERKRAEVAESLDDFEATLDDYEPPVDWAAVEKRLQAQFDELGIEVR